MPKLRRWLILVHRYLGIALSLLFLLWFVSGIGMIYAGGMPRLSPDERLTRLSPIDFAAVRITPADAAERAGVRNPGRLTLLTVMDRPAFRFGGREPATVFADNGELLGDVGQEGIVAIAAKFMGVPVSSVHYIRELDEADQWTIGQRRQLPLHQLSIDDGAGTVVYVSEPTADVVMKTTRANRVLAWAAAIPHWLYFAPLRLRDRTWTNVVVWSSGLASVGALLGLALAVTQYRVKYSGWMRWHYWTGVGFGVFALTWAFSGLLSMEPFEWFSRRSGSDRIAQALSGGPLDLSAFPAFDAAAWSDALSGHQVKELEFRRVLGEPHYVARAVSGSERPVLLRAAPLAIRELFAPDTLATRVQDGYPKAMMADARVISEYDAYYYDRDREALLPALRVKFADSDGTWVYVDAMGQVAARFTRRQRLERWLYHGLHSLDFPFWYFSRWWDVGMIALLAGGTALSLIGVVIGFRRLGRALRL